VAFLPALAEAAAPALLSIGASAIAGGAQNGAMSAMNSWDENFQLGLYASQMQHQEQLSMQSALFDEATAERSENMREINTLRNVEMAQIKADNDITKKFIQSISA